MTKHELIILKKDVRKFNAAISRYSNNIFHTYKNYSEIYLGKNKWMIVDTEDLPSLLCFKWKLISNSRHPSTNYFNGEKTFLILVHRYILGVLDNEKICVDHKDMNPLNNMKSNLRTCTHSQNNLNSFGGNKKTRKYKGYVWNKEKKKWLAKTVINGKFYFGGYHKTEELAAIAYNELATRLHGEFARLNNIRMHA